MKLKVLALGKRNSINRISRALNGSDISITCRSDVNEALNLLKKDKFDLALVDAYMDDIETICYRITWLCKTPIAAVINGSQDDWDILRKLDADGFIPEESGNVEISSYFTSIARHITDNVDPIRILVIEDDEHIQEALKLSFQMYWPGTEAIFSSNGLDGVKQARLQNVDAILLDLKLPDIYGLEALQRIRSFSQIPVMIITASHNSEDVIKCMRAGANDFLVKPFRQLELLSRIRRMNGSRQPVGAK